MNTHAEKTKKNKSNTASFSAVQNQSTSKSSFQLTDNRQEAVAQRKLKEIADNSPGVAQLSAIQDIANKSSHDNKSAQLKKRLSSSSDTPVQLQVEAVAKNKKYTNDEAVKNLEESRKEGNSNIIATWIGYILKKMKPKAGKVLSTYVSSFDTAKGGFSASRELPDVKELVVHAHYKREKNERDKAKVNSAQVKWSDNEAGGAPPGETKLTTGKEPEILGSDHEKVAIKAWEDNPERHKMRQDAEAKKEAKQKEGPLDLEWLFPTNAQDSAIDTAPTNTPSSTTTPSPSA
jgi:hypothetical protein